MIFIRSLASLWQLIATTTWFVGVCEEFAQNVLRWQASRRWIAPSGADEEFPTSDACEHSSIVILNVTFLTCLLDPLIPFVLLPPTLSLFRRILGHVLQVRAIFQGMATRNQAIVVAKEQLKAAFDASPLQFDEFPSLIRQLEEEASRMLQGGRVIFKEDVMFDNNICSRRWRKPKNYSRSARGARSDP
jgi:hypothetical protein